MTAAPVTIVRKKGRIAGYSQPSVPCEVLWAGTNRPNKKFSSRKNGWSFPPAVREKLLQECEGRTVLHLFGGRADFGCRLDVDPETNPDILGDAYIAHHYFQRDQFQVVILDPPYSEALDSLKIMLADPAVPPEIKGFVRKQHSMRKQQVMNLMDVAAHIASEHVYWFHTVTVATHRVLPQEHMWLVRCGDQCAVRALQKFRVLEPKRRPPEPGDFTRGPALKYNRWASVIAGLPFDGVDYPPLLAPDPKQRAVCG